MVQYAAMVTWKRKHGRGLQDPGRTRNHLWLLAGMDPGG